MAEPPSESLLRTLQGLRLCSAADLRRCRPRVRRMTSDLPAFDSVWIDALQHHGRLTPFQARRLDEGDGESLRVGPCVLVDRLGPASTGRTFVARHRDSDDICVLKILPREHVTADESNGRRLRELVEGAKGFSHPAIVGPRRFEEYDGNVVVVSDRVDGPSLEELLIRRGRFGERVVSAIGRQLAEGLAALEAAGRTHGDLRTPNLRLLPSGRIVAVDAGVRPAFESDIRLRERDAPERYDGIAPERIGNGRPADGPSEVYAFGCLLWTLLAGRPPFPIGDVLGKLAAHRGQDVPDIEEIAPETPAEVVRLVRATTHRDPSQRPQSFSQVVRALGPSRSTDRSTLSNFHASFDRSAPKLPRSADDSGSRRGRLTAAALLVAGLSASMLHDGLRNGVTDVARSTGGVVTSWFDGPAADAPIAEVDETRPTGDSRLPLPEPDEEGLVLLDSAGPYLVRELATVGRLELRAAPGVRPVVEIDEQPFKLWAEELRISGVTVRSTGAETSALLLVRCQKLSLADVVLDGRDPGSRDPDSEAASEPESSPTRYLLAWKPLDERDADGGTVEIDDSRFLGEQPALFASTPPRTLSTSNVLKVGSGAMVEFATNPRPGADATLKLANVTLRGATHLLRCIRRRAEAGVTWIEADDCVFDLAGPGASLLAWVASESTTPDRVQFEGRGSVTSPGVPTAVLTDRAGTTYDAGRHGNVIVEGLTANRVRFAGTADDPNGSVVRSVDGPRLGGGRPGFDIRRVAAEPSRDLQ